MLLKKTYPDVRGTLFMVNTSFFCYMVIRCEWQTVLNRDYNSFLLLLNILFSAKSQLFLLFFFFLLSSCEVLQCY